MPSTRQMLDVPATTSSSPALKRAVEGFAPPSGAPPSFTDVSAMMRFLGLSFDPAAHSGGAEVAGAHGNRTHLPACDRYHGFEARGAHQVPYRSHEAAERPDSTHSAPDQFEIHGGGIFDAHPKVVKRNSFCSDSPACRSWESIPAERSPTSSC